MEFVALYAFSCSMLSSVPSHVSQVQKLRSFSKLLLVSYHMLVSRLQYPSLDKVSLFDRIGIYFGGIVFLRRGISGSLFAKPWWNISPPQGIAGTDSKLAIQVQTSQVVSVHGW